MNKVCLAILDGYGVTGKKTEGKVFSGSLITKSLEKDEQTFFDDFEKTDAMQSSSDRLFKSLFKNNPHTLLFASGLSVGLPSGQMGNSEVGHLNIGAGHLVPQDLMRINLAFQNGEYKENSTFMKFFSHKEVTHHIVGLVSNGNIHSNIEHLKKIMKIAKENDVKLFIHAITDGRDTSITSGIKFIKEIQELCKETNCKISSISGRYYAMDREKNLDRTNAYFDVITGEEKSSLDINGYINKSYKDNVTDEFIKPALFVSDGKIKPKDYILTFNFRADRMRQIVQKFLDNENKVFTMTEYKKEFKKANVIFKPKYEKNVLSEIIAKKGLKQLKVAEFSKYAHVTYFLNGGREQPFENEDRVMVPMANVPTFDLKPEMSAKGVTSEVKKGMEKGYDFICVNYANCDMVGHTGVLKATEKAVKVCTGEILKLYKKAIECNYILVVTADHGNCECMFANDEVCTTHTTNRVPFIILNSKEKLNLKPNGSLSNVAPTVLELMNK